MMYFIMQKLDELQDLALEHNLDITTQIKELKELIETLEISEFNQGFDEATSIYVPDLNNE